MRKCLSCKYSVRNAVVAPWLNRFNVKVAQDFIIYIAGRPTTLQIGADLLNVGNLINSNWGLVKQYDREDIINYKSGVYTFTAPKEVKYLNTVNTWQALLSARLFF